MSDQELLQYFLVFVVGAIVGVLATFFTNKVRSGSASPIKIKQEFEQYQEDVESHFEETSKKFKDLTTQYQDLYKHMSIGATTLCRPENRAKGLSDESMVLTATAIEKKSDEQKSAANKASVDKQQSDNPQTGSDNKGTKSPINSKQATVVDKKKATGATDKSASKSTTKKDRSEKANQKQKATQFAVNNEGSKSSKNPSKKA